MKVRCKILEGKDSQQYRRLRLESLRTHPECFGAEYQAQHKMPKLYFEQVIESDLQNSIMIGAFDNDSLIGLCGLIPTEKHELEVVQMYVSPLCRGQAVGTKMLQKAKEIFESRPERKIILTTYEANKAALRVYEKFGFNRVDTSGKEIKMALNPKRISAEC